jgi:hypothetical protein
MKIATCVYLLHNNDNYVQMAQQQRKILGFKGYGGVVEEDQTIRGNAVQELWEETGGKKELRINPDQEGGIFTREELLIPAACIDFYNGEDVLEGYPSFRVYFFLCRRFAGKAIDTVEMKHHQLFHVRNLPIDRLVKGDELFIPRLLSGICLTGSVRRSADWSTIIADGLKEVSQKDLCF